MLIGVELLVCSETATVLCYVFVGLGFMDLIASIGMNIITRLGIRESKEGPRIEEQMDDFESTELAETK